MSEQTVFGRAVQLATKAVAAHFWSNETAVSFVAEAACGQTDEELMTWWENEFDKAQEAKAETES